MWRSIRRCSWGIWLALGDDELILVLNTELQDLIQRRNRACVFSRSQYSSAVQAEHKLLYLLHLYFHLDEM